MADNGRDALGDRRDDAASHETRAPFGARPDVIDRRRWVRTAGGLLVAIALGERCDQPGSSASGANSGTLSLSVTGLGQGATSGGSVSATRVDVPTPPVSIPISASGSASATVPAGTYRVAYTAPSGYSLAPGAVNPQTQQVTAGQTTPVSFPVQVVIGFPPPDILNSASFETDWSGFTNGASNTPPSPSAGAFSITRSQDVAYDGSWSAKSTFGSGGGAVGFAYKFGDHLDVSYRVYFYATNHPTDHHKWLRMQTAGGGQVQGGLYVRIPDGVTWADTSVTNSDADLGIGVPTLNAWHWIEARYDRTNWNTSNGVRVRVWYDGAVKVGTNPPATAFWGDDSGTPNPAGPWLYMGKPASGANPSAILAIDDTYNSGNVNLGSYYYDFIAISTQRLGP